MQLNSQMERDEAKLKKRLSSYYDKEYRKLEKEISGYYQQYGEDNVIEYRKLMESLPDEDKRLLIQRMDDFTEKYPEYADVLPVRESIYKLNRLEGLQTSIRMQQFEIGAVNNWELQKHLQKQALRGVNAAAEMMGFGYNYYANNPDVVNRFVNVPWSNGKNFSDRIWNNSSKLADYLNTDIAQGIARGDSYERLVRGVKQRFSRVTRNDAFRLIYTEGTFVQAESTMQPFIEDFEKYRISTVEDEKVCPICRAASQQVFRIQDRRPGVNFPPFHAWCRCTFTIEVDDWDKWIDEYEEKHSNGQANKVAKNLTSNNKMLPQGRVKQQSDTDRFVSEMQIYYSKNQNADMNTFARKVLDSLKLNNVPVNVKSMKDWGYCSMKKTGNVLNVLDYNLRVRDARSQSYKIKTAFHEAFHAKADGLKTDFGNILKSHWLHIEETFAESSAHYMAEKMGIIDLTPSYADKLLDVLPRLKQLPEFETCTKISDFGKVALENRMNGVASEWEVLYDKAKKVPHNWKKYSKHYFPEISKDIDSYVDKMLENMPQYKDYKPYMMDDAKNAMQKVESGGILSSNEELVLSNLASIAMNRLGVK